MRNQIIVILRYTLPKCTKLSLISIFYGLQLESLQLQLFRRIFPGERKKKKSNIGQKLMKKPRHSTVEEYVCNWWLLILV